MTGWKKSGVFAVAWLACALSASAVQAPYGIPWKQPRFSYYAQGESLPDTLRRFTASLGIQTIVSEKVKGTVSGKFDRVRPDEFLDAMANAFGLIWFFDGNVLYIYDDSEIQGKIIEAPGVDDYEFIKILRNLGINTKHPHLSFRLTEGIISISGPPRYVSLVEDVVKSIRAVDLATPDAIEVYPLVHAWAYDTTFTSGSSQVTVPGIATVMQNLLPSYASGAYGAGQGITQQVPPTIASLTNTSVRDPNTANPLVPGSGQQQQRAPTTPDGPDVSSIPAQTAGSSYFDPLVTYDVRMNAVVIRDTKDRLRGYRKVIKDLDKPVKIVQIQVNIVDINLDYALEYGSQFLFSFDGGTQLALTDPAAGTSSSSSSSSGSSTTGSTISDVINGASDILAAGGLNFAPIIMDQTVDFLGRIQLLQSDGYANILSQPSVVTLDNLEAVIESTETFYVQVGGTFSNDLYNVSAGTTLSVTPHIIEQDGEDLIKMVVTIEDGQIEDSNSETFVSGLPLTTQDTLNTQAVLKESESLLVGGLISETNEVTETGVPGIKDLPVLGFLFKQRTKSVTRLKRLFLITPHVVTQSYRPTEDVTPIFDTLQEQAAQRDLIRSQLMKQPDGKSASLRPTMTEWNPDPRVEAVFELPEPQKPQRTSKGRSLIGPSLPRADEVPDSEPGGRELILSPSPQ